MKYIVTGGAGFIGSNLVEVLLEKGHEVYVVDNFSTGIEENIYVFRNNQNLHVLKTTVNDLNHWVVTQFKSRLKNADAIIHLAALPRVQLSIDDPLRTHEANVDGTLNVLEFARKIGIKKVIYASSSSVYGDQEELPLHEDLIPNPLNPYAYQKYMGELLCRMYAKVYGLNTYSLRFFNVYGKNMSMNGAYKLVFMNWIESIKNGESMKIYGDGLQTRDFTHVSDVCSAITLIAEKQETEKGINRIYNVGGGSETSVIELAKLFEYPYEHVEARPFEEQRKIADLTEIKKIGWEPKIGVNDGVNQLKKEYDI